MKDKIVNLYDKVCNIKPDTTHTCGNKTCVFYDVECEASKFAKYCVEHGIYFTEVKNV